MDDVFQIIIYLLIIISFIAPIFKKKDQQKKQQQQRQRFPHQNNFEEPVSSNTALETKQQDYDVLKELENFFKVGNAEESQTENFIEEEKIEESLEERATPYQPEWKKKKAEVEKVVRVLDKKIEKQAKQFEDQLAYQQVRQTNKLVLQLKNNIRNPSTLREYILFSEIIGKPKALRR